MYTLYTDGSAIPNPGPCGAGGVLIDADENIIWTLSEFLGQGTNNIGELTAILRGLQRYCELDLDAEPLNIYSDSELSVTLINGTKTTKKPHLLKILEPILELKNKLQITIMWVKAHSTNKWNNYADTLANNAVSQANISIVDEINSINAINAINAINSNDANIHVSTSASTSVISTAQSLLNSKPRILLSCSFKEKDKVKSLGARWDPGSKSWWVEDKPENQETFAKWIVAN
jgi:ribonuclease HI